jgi:hypothetical protein
MVKASLATKQEAVLYLEYSGFGVTENDIPDSVDSLNRMLVTMWLERESISFDAIEDLDDKHAYGFIWAASFCSYLEILSMRGQNQFSSGDVQRVRTGKVETMFQRWQPMFFFSKGAARGFYELLPHDTYRMMFFQLLKSWKEWHFKKTRPNEVRRGTRVGYIDEELGEVYPDVMERL